MSDDVNVARLRAFFADHGWALGLHGSCARDMDFIAVPWVAEHPTEVGALVGCVSSEFNRMSRGPTWKPHGRMAWAFSAREYEGGCPPREWDISFVDPRNAISRGFPRL